MRFYRNAGESARTADQQARQAWTDRVERAILRAEKDSYLGARLVQLGADPPFYGVFFSGRQFGSVERVGRRWRCAWLSRDGHFLGASGAVFRSRRDAIAEIKIQTTMERL